jgi:hypothetical protein
MPSPALGSSFDATVLAHMEGFFLPSQASAGAQGPVSSGVAGSVFGQINDQLQAQVPLNMQMQPQIQGPPHMMLPQVNNKFSSFPMSGVLSGGSVTPMNMVNSIANAIAMDSGAGVKRKADEESKDEKQERIRQRNRVHARSCRIRKRQAVEDLNKKVDTLQDENTMLKNAFRVMYNQKALMDAMVVSEFGEKGSLLLDKIKEGQQRSNGKNNTLTVASEKTAMENSAVSKKPEMPKLDPIT